MGKIKVLHIHTRPIVGGSGTNTLLSMLGLPKDKFYPVLACGGEGPLVDEAIKNSLEVAILPHLKNKINVFNDFLALFEIMQLIKKENFTIVHTHNSKAGILGRFAAKFCRVPIIIHTLHSCVFKYPNLNWFQKKSFLFIEKLAACFTHKLIAISEPLKEEFIRAKMAAEDKFITIYSGIEIDSFQKNVDVKKKKQELGIPLDCIIIGIVGRLDNGKGHEFVLKAIPYVVKENSKIKFIFVGDGPLKETLKNLTKELKIEKYVIFIGLRNDIPELLPVFDIFCLASLYEGMGRVILEAQAAGKPVIATKIGGIPDIVFENKTAILVPPRDTGSLADAIIKLVQNSDLRLQMSKQAREFVDYRFSSDKMVKNIIKLYEEFLESTSYKC